MTNLPSWANDSQSPVESSSLPAWAEQSDSNAPIAPASTVIAPINPTVSKNATVQPALSKGEQAYKDLYGEPKPFSYYRDQVYAGSLGVEQALKSIAATGAKAVAHFMNPSLKKDIQSQYEQDVQNFANTKAVQEHPIAAGAGSLLGGIAATAGIPMGSAIPVAKTVAPIAGKIAGYGTGILAGAGEGAAMGSIFTSPGQGSDVLNKFNAAIGGLAGGLLAPVGIRGSNYAENTQNFNKSLEQTGVTYKGTSVPGAEYKGPVFARDFLDRETTRAANEFWDNLGSVGTVTYRIKQQEGVRDSLLGLNTYLLQKAQNNPTQVISNQLKKANADFLDQRNQMFNSVYAKLDTELGKVEIPPTYKQSVTGLVDEYGSLLTKQEKQTLGMLQNIKQANPSALKTIKNSVWDIVDRIERKSNPTIQEDDLVYSLKEVYRQTKGIVEDKLTSANKLDLLTEYNSANQFERIRQEVFSPKLHPEFIKAINDKAQELNDVNRFINFLTNPKQSGKAVQKYMGLIGKEGQNALESQQFTKLLESNLDRSTPSPTLNLHGFLKQWEGLRQTNQKLVTEEAYNSLRGLFTVVGKPNVQAKLDAAVNQDVAKSTKYIAGAAATTIGVRGGGLTGGLGTLLGISASMKTLATIAANSPLKRMLNYVNQTLESPGMSEYLIDRAATLLQRAGVLMTVTPDGKPTLQHKDEIIKNLKKVSMQTPISPYQDPAQPTPQEHRNHEDMMRQIDQGRDDYASKKNKSILS